MVSEYHQIVAKEDTETRFDRVKRYISYRDDYDYNDDETLREILDIAENELGVGDREQ